MVNEIQARSILNDIVRRTIDSIAIDQTGSIANTRIQEACGLLAREYRDGRIHIVGLGKAAPALTKTVLDCLPEERVDRVIVASPYGSWTGRSGVCFFQGGHPLPNEASFAAARHALTFLESLHEDEHVIFLITGGGSSCFELPLYDKVTLEDMRQLNEALTTCGANIVDINCVRKHVSAVKGGRLAQTAYPARQHTLFVSDCPENMENTIASGPTFPDESTNTDAIDVIRRFNLISRIPSSIQSLLSRANETPKPDSIYFSRSSYRCLLSNKDALESARAVANSHGIMCLIDNSADEEDVDVASSRLISRLEKLSSTRVGPVAIVAGGEVLVEVTGPGKGGRNQAFVLSCIARIAGKNIAVISAGTDGVDGNSDDAGAIATGTSLERAIKQGIDLDQIRKNSNSNQLFGALDDLLVTGATGNNVRDLRMLVAW